MNQRNYRILSFLIVTAVILACMPTFGSAATPPPAFDPNSVNTSIVLTANSAANQTALMVPPTVTPTLTLFPTSTLAPSETPSATFIFILSSPTRPTSTITALPTPVGGGTPGQAAKFACKWITQSPKDGTVFPPKSDFDMIWHVKNTGTEPWKTSSTDYRWVSGDTLHTRFDIYDLNTLVKPGENVDITVDMSAPRESGTYSTTWRLFTGSTSFCPLDVVIYVK